jgi:hypothetical protein
MIGANDMVLIIAHTADATAISRISQRKLDRCLSGVASIT